MTDNVATDKKDNQSSEDAGKVVVVETTDVIQAMINNATTTPDSNDNLTAVTKHPKEDRKCDSTAFGNFDADSGGIPIGTFGVP